MRILLQYPVACVFLAGWFASDLLTPFVRWMAGRIGLVDVPGGHKQHKAPVATLGGIAVYLAFLISILASLEMSRALLALVVGGAVIVAAGVADDVRGVGAVVKLGVIGVATAILVHSGTVMTLGLSVAAGTVITFLWIGFVTSAFNGVDNADGSASGLAAIASLSVFAIAWPSWQHDLGIVAAALVGCSLGFLRYNFPPATIFLGDSGSFFLGFALSAMLALGHWGNSVLKDIIVPITILGVPLFDFMLILVLRGLEGKYRTWTDPITMCARDHTAHRLMALGLSPRETALSLYAAGVLCGSAALWMYTLPDRQAALVFVLVVGIALAAATALRGVGREPAPLLVAPDS